MRLLFGLIKGIVIGGIVGLGAYALHWTGGFHWFTYGLVGALVGLFVGRPFWSHMRDPKSTVVISVVKSVVGYGVGVGIYFLVTKVAGGTMLPLGGESRALYDWQPLMGGVVGGLYGAWVELDDAPAAIKS